jgi:hypothetical protein
MLMINKFRPRVCAKKRGRAKKQGHPKNVWSSIHFSVFCKINNSHSFCNKKSQKIICTGIGWRTTYIFFIFFRGHLRPLTQICYLLLCGTKKYEKNICCSLPPIAIQDFFLEFFYNFFLRVINVSKIEKMYGSIHFWGGPVFLCGPVF